MTDLHNPSEAAAFLGDLWPTKPPTAAIQLWEKRNKKTYTFTEAAAAARYGVQQSAASDIYVAAGLAASAGKPSGTRASAADVVGIPGLWGDVDVNGGPDNKTHAAPTMGAALELARTLLEPTLLVGSGYGVQPWWLFEEPWVFSGPDGVAQREQAARLSRGFNGALRAAAAKLEPDWRLDSTFDLARLMRLPGTLNHKGIVTVPVTLLEHEGPRHDFAVFYELASDFMREQAASGDVAVDLAGAIDLPIDRILELCQSNPDFAAVWNHASSKKTDGWTPNQWDQSITNYLYDSGFTHQEIAAALDYQERRYYPTRDKSKHGVRDDYIKRTIGKAVTASKRREAKAEAETERVEVLEQLAEIADAPSNGVVENAREVVIDLFDRLVRGPKIDGLLQEGRDPTTARFTLVLADGTDVPLGNVKGLTQQQTFREKFLVVTKHYPDDIKKSQQQPVSWADIVRALMKAVTIIEHPDDTRVRIVLERVAGYCEERGMSTEKDMACQLCSPFEADNPSTGERLVHIHLESFVQWLVTRKVRFDEPDLKSDLRRAGFERRGINYQHQTKGRSFRQYWRAPRKLLEPREDEE